MGASSPRSHFVFTHPDGGGLWPQTVTRRFRDIANSLELPEVGVHGLRHTCATWMISEGISPKVVVERLGHSHVSITLALYVPRPRPRCCRRVRSRGRDRSRDRCDRSVTNP